MTDLTKIEKPFVFCTSEEQAGLDALKTIPGALQHLGVGGKWDRLLCWDTGLTMHLTYRQNPDWQPPKLDVPDWFWRNTVFNWVCMDRDGTFWGYEVKPAKGLDTWGGPRETSRRLDHAFAKRNFNPDNIPWDKSLTKRPEETNDT